MSLTGCNNRCISLGRALAVIARPKSFCGSLMPRFDGVRGTRHPAEDTGQMKSETKSRASFAQGSAANKAVFAGQSELEAPFTGAQDKERRGDL